MFPTAVFVVAGVGGHVNCCAGNWQRSFAASQTISDFSAGSGGGSVEGFYSGGEVVSFGFERNHRFNVAGFEKIGFVSAGGSKLFNAGALVESHVIFISRNQFIGIGFRSFANQFEQGILFGFSINDKCTIKNFVPAMFGINLRKTENFAVGEVAANFFGYFFQVFYFIGT